MTYSLTWLPAVLNKTVEVKEYPGWETRGHGDVGEIKFVLCHHSATGANSDPVKEMEIVVFGRPDLEGPLSQLWLDRKGVFYVIAAGKGYHAGRGEWRGITDGNSHSIGIEAENNGVDEEWPEVQMTSYAKGVAAIIKHIGANINACVAHKEWAPLRKIDPDFDMKLFRKRVQKYLT